MFELNDEALNWLILGFLLLFAALLGIIVVRRRGGPSGGSGSGLKYQLADSPGSVVSHCPKCGAPTKGFYENCPVCGEKIGERLAVAKTL